MEGSILAKNSEQMENKAMPIEQVEKVLSFYGIFDKTKLNLLLFKIKFVGNVVSGMKDI